MPSFRRHGLPAPSDVIWHAVSGQARRGHAPGRWRCPMAVVLRCGAMSSMVSEQGAFDALCPSDRLALSSVICTLLTLCLPAFNAELENMRLGRPPIPTGSPQTGCKRGGVVRLSPDAPLLPSLRCPRARVHHHTSSATRIKRGTQSAGGGAVLSAHRRRTRGVTSQMPPSRLGICCRVPCSTAAAAPEEVLSRISS